MIEFLTQPFGPLAIGLVLLASVGLPTVLVVYWATRNRPIKPVDKSEQPTVHGWPQEDE